jgi:parallel beta-helix repeat protein
MIDRDYSPSEVREERRISSRVTVLALIVIAAVILGAVTGLMIQMINDGKTHPAESPVRNPAGMLYTTHSPILIVGNAWFTNVSGVVWGSGTASDPYIIEDWDINASTTDGISVRDTDAYFIIRDCYIHDGETGYIGGIYLLRCANGTVSNNTCSNNRYGVELAFSRNINITGNTCISNYFGGIDMYFSRNITLSNNVLFNNGIFIDGQYPSECTAYDIGTSNTVNGKPVYYYRNQSGTTVPGGAGEIILANCTGFIIEDQNLSNATVGIELAFSSDIVINNSICSNNFYGIILLSSNNNTVSNTKCSNNMEGMILVYSSNNTLWNNNCSRNFDGIQLGFSSNNTLSNNNCSSNDGYGIALSFSNSNNTISGNQAYNNTGYGVYIDLGSNNSVWNNTFIDNNGAGDHYDSNYSQAYDGGTNNSWNSTDGYGNYWSDWTTPDAVPPWGIVDQPYNISGSVSKDFYPLTTTPSVPIPEFRTMPLMLMALLAVIVLAGKTRQGKKSEP